MGWIVIAAIIVVGLIFLLLEILVVPGTTVVGFVGAAMMVFGVYSTYSSYGITAGTFTLAGTLILSVGAITLALKSNTWNKAMLHTEISSRVNVVEDGKVKPGDEGTSVTRLNPMGKALINEDYYEVTSKDNLIDQNTPIVVTKVEGNKIIVKSKS
ncbi:MAG: NfeD family protein [Bacteroidota bacterium]